MLISLGAIEEEDVTFTVTYTTLNSINGWPFYAIGKCRIGLN
jgi:hypothetical protein